MIHLFKHQSGKLKGKFDIALVVRGKYIVGSNQGYERKIGAINAIRVAWTEDVYFQDNSFEKPVVYRMPSAGGKRPMYLTVRRPHKPYQPQTIKK